MKPLFSRDYIAMALSGNYRMERIEPIKIRYWHIILERLTVLVYYSLYLVSFSPGWRMIIDNLDNNAVGFMLRACYWRRRLCMMGTNVFVDKNVEIWCPDRVCIGNDVHLEIGVVISGMEGIVVIGSRVNIGYYSIIQGRGKVFIGSDCGIAPHVAIYSSTHYQWFPNGERMAESPMSKNKQYIKSAPVKILHHSYIKYGSLITHGDNGVVIGPYGFVLPNSIVKEDVPPETMVGGNPAKYVRMWSETINE